MRSDLEFKCFGERLQELIDDAANYADPSRTDVSTGIVFDLIHTILCEARDKYDDMLKISE